MLEYDKIIREQTKLGIVEIVKEPEALDKGPHHSACYLPHHGVVHISSQTTKLCIVSDGSTCTPEDDCSLNDCLDQTICQNYLKSSFNLGDTVLL